MQDSKQGLQTSPEYTIHYLSQGTMRLTQGNAMLKAYVQENKENQRCTEEEQSLALSLYRNLRGLLNYGKGNYR